MNLALFISRRTARATSSTQSVIMRIATAAVAASAAVSLITLAIVFGFKEEIQSVVRGTMSEVIVTDLRTLNATQSRPVEATPELTELIASAHGVKGINAYTMRGCVIRSSHQSMGILLKGIDSTERLEWFASQLEEGATPAIDGTRKKEIMIPRTTAKSLAVEVGDRIEIMLLDGERPQRDVMKVCGIYSSIGDEAMAAAITDIRNLQKINGWSDTTVSGFEIALHDGADADLVADQINTRLWEDYEGEANLSAIAAKELYAPIFAWLGTHDINAAVVICIMFAVALFNMITALLILVFERTRTIGILKSLGMDNRTIRRIFLYQAARLTAQGLLIGNAIGLGIVALQHYTGLVRLDASAYFVSEVPMRLTAVDVVGLNIGFTAAILLMVFVATAITARIKPSEAVKYE
ncbi:MAG: ABC transporter permease [Alistipes sp.]|nr:ABC transporter permease [Alistipes sp.]